MQQLKFNNYTNSNSETIKKKRSASVKAITLYYICEGFDISLEQFFNSPLFDRENIED